jgi:hypothetical protein
MGIFDCPVTKKENKKMQALDNTKMHALNLPLWVAYIGYKSRT